MTNPTANPGSPPPSHFAALGPPSCSMWGKAEVEWLAHDYVQALARDGDIWKPLTREQVAPLVPRDKRSSYGSVLSDDYYLPRFNMVRDQLSSAAGASAVWRVDFGTLARLMGVR